DPDRAALVGRDHVPVPRQGREDLGAQVREQAVGDSGVEGDARLLAGVQEPGRVDHRWFSGMIASASSMGATYGSASSARPLMSTVLATLTFGGYAARSRVLA